jgi:glycosyltransferase involved in cell wall biosynthesis
VKVGIDASLASRHGTGTGRYAALLVQHLVARDRVNDYVLYFRRRDRGDNPLLSLTGPRVQARITDAPLTLLRLHVNLSLRLRRDGIDVYHSLGFFVPWLWRGKSVVTIHDIHPVLLPQHWWRAGTRTSYLALRLHIPISLRQARWIIVPSQYVKDTICQRFHVSCEKILVAPHGADPFFLTDPSPAEVEAVEQRWGARPFFLYVGELAPHKNPQGAVQALARLRARCPDPDARLIIVGPPAGPYQQRELVPLIQRLGVSRDVVLSGYLDDTVLRALYRRAVALVLPSFGEGFGLPLLEAMACGTPLITSPVSALPEVAGDAALYANPRDPDAIAAAMERLLVDDKLRAEQGARARARLSGFTWDRPVDQVLRAYRDG